MEVESTDGRDVVKVNRLQVAVGRTKETESREKVVGNMHRGPWTDKDKEMVKRVWCSFEVLSCMDNPSQRAVEMKRGVVWRSWTSGGK
jgi:hypothetical protein